MLRPYFLHHRELLGLMTRLAYDTVREMMAAAGEVTETSLTGRFSGLEVDVDLARGKSVWQ